MYVFKLLKTKRNRLLYGISPYRAVNTFHHGYKIQSVNDVNSKSRCLFWDRYKHSTQGESQVEFLMLNLVVR